MFRKVLLPAALAVAMLGVVPAFADENGSTEQKTEQRPCGEPADAHYSAPQDSDCEKDADGEYVGDGTYEATYYSNDVKCGEENTVVPNNPSGIRIYASGDSSGGGTGFCSDGSGDAPAPVQGRAGVSGSSEGATVKVDGDKDNGTISSKLAGYVVVKAGPGGASAGCGKPHTAGGKSDSDVPNETEQANCSS